MLLLQQDTATHACCFCCKTCLQEHGCAHQAQGYISHYRSCMYGISALSLLSLHAHSLLRARDRLHSPAIKCSVLLLHALDGEARPGMESNGCPNKAQHSTAITTRLETTDRALSLKCIRAAGTAICHVVHWPACSWPRLAGSKHQSQHTKQKPQQLVKTWLVEFCKLLRHTWLLPHTQSSCTGPSRTKCACPSPHTFFTPSPADSRPQRRPHACTRPLL